MIGLDTNVLVRYLAQDDPEQSALADEVFEGLSGENPAFVSTVVLVETCWVLRRMYKMRGKALLGELEELVSAEELKIERQDRVRRALRLAEKGADFADALIQLSGRDAGCEHTVTFDRGAAKHAGMRLLA